MIHRRCSDSAGLEMLRVGSTSSRDIKNSASTIREDVEEVERKRKSSSVAGSCRPRVKSTYLSSMLAPRFGN